MDFHYRDHHSVSWTGAMSLMGNTPRNHRSSSPPKPSKSTVNAERFGNTIAETLKSAIRDKKNPSLIVWLIRPAVWSIRAFGWIEKRLAK